MLKDWECSNPLPVYQTPPPFAESIKLAVVPVPKDPVFHEVTKVPSSVYNQEHPLEVWGKLEYLPVPSSHDWDKANTYIFWLTDKFLCSVENSCKLEVILLLKDKACLMSEFLNWIRILEG